MAPSLEDIVKGLTKFVERGHEFKPGERDLLIAAAEQLVELSNLLGAEKSANNYLSFKIDCYSKDICKVAAERDEARRLFCEDRFNNGKHYRSVGEGLVVCASPKEIAEALEWDCFKENTNG